MPHPPTIPATLDASMLDTEIPQAMGNHVPPPIQNHRGDVFPIAPENQPSPTKPMLRSEVDTWRSELANVNQQAFNAMENQQQSFRLTAQAFEQQARDIAMAEVAGEGARVQANYDSRLQHEQAVIERAQNRLLQSNHRAQQQTSLVRQEAQAALSEQCETIIRETREALDDQHRLLCTEANETMAQRQDALIVEATGAFQEQDAKLQQAEYEAEERYQMLQATATGQIENLR